ncbi:hypothetical protein ACFLW8_03370 [Chloroflexota bacterium]
MDSSNQKYTINIQEDSLNEILDTAVFLDDGKGMDCLVPEVSLIGGLTVTNPDSYKKLLKASGYPPDKFKRTQD